ncbi:MAG: thiol-disulfide oxidoreductase [Flavobacteriaceae bacterium]|nr:thiol-disulfide oxidoreductase [Flavobacteriaceae bacterium]
MNFRKIKKGDILFLILVVLMVVPQTRQPIQIAFHSVVSLFSPSVINPKEQKEISYEPWKLKDLDGNEFDFSNTKNRVVIVNLWATWCPPCIAEFQGIQNLYDDYGKKVDFILVSDESPKAIQKFLKRNGYNIKVFTPLTQYPSYFTTKSIPRTYIIDKQGRIVIDKHGAANWNSSSVREQLDKLLTAS